MGAPVTASGYAGTRRGLFREEQANGSGNTGIIPVFFGIEEDGVF